MTTSAWTAWALPRRRARSAARRSLDIHCVYKLKLNLYFFVSLNTTVSCGAREGRLGSAPLPNVARRHLSLGAPSFLAERRKRHVERSVILSAACSADVGESEGDTAVREVARPEQQWRWPSCACRPSWSRSACT